MKKFSYFLVAAATLAFASCNALENATKTKVDVDPIEVTIPADIDAVAPEAVAYGNLGDAAPYHFGGTSDPILYSDYISTEDAKYFGLVYGINFTADLSVSSDKDVIIKNFNLTATWGDGLNDKAVFQINGEYNFATEGSISYPGNNNLKVFLASVFMNGFVKKQPIVFTVDGYTNLSADDAFSVDVAINDIVVTGGLKL